MQDRYKFRGKRLDNNKWYYGSYLYLHNADKFDWNGTRHSTNEDVHYIIDENDVNYGVNPETVCQCIGLKDKNDKLIYEDDILYCPNNNFFKFIIKKYEPYTECVLYDYQEKHKCNWRFNQIEETRIKNNKLTNLEVVGNIYDNPELLKDEV